MIDRALHVGSAKERHDLSTSRELPILFKHFQVGNEVIET